jgi:catalase
MANTVKDSIKTRRIAILAADGVEDTELSTLRQALNAAGGQTKIVAPRSGSLTGTSGTEVSIDFSLLTAGSVLFDAVYVPGGARSIATLKQEAQALHFIHEAYKHCKPIAVTGGGVELLRASYLGVETMSESPNGESQVATKEGVIIGRAAQAGSVAAEFVQAIAQHRYWNREMKDHVPA